ncbi:MFS transporter [Humisphaera borealis]|uniref:MFS transporter n=1 Tax=Humisphaera borealis TaxID=2807512 RepID=A0A7M2WTX6_9BACT|nr:MFS transporter [Humisphaera borealis]QOV88968.1 MFS transporter [Humisphaera borealis]
MPTTSRHLRRWQTITLTLLVIGYAGYYLCRANLSATTPMIIDELRAKGIPDPKVSLGDITALGTLLYAIGKFFAGVSGDLLGGRRNFLGGMGGAILFTALFALSGSLPLMTLAWMGNRFVQSFGWPALVRLGGRWSHYSVHGFVLGLLSLSYLFGDAASRLFMGVLIDAGLGWRAIFFTNAGIVGGLFVVTWFALRESPRAVGEPDFPPNPSNVYAATPATTAESLAVDHVSLTSLLVPLLRSPAFWTVCLLSLAMTLLRETFNNWTPTYFTEVLKLGKGAAASNSAWFPLLGGIAVVVFGLLSDRLGKAGRSACMAAGLAMTGATLWLMAGVTNPVFGVVLVAVAGFMLIGPYSFLAGAMALDFGGRRGAATAAGIIDGVGYLAGVLAGSAVARLATSDGWDAVFHVLAGVAWMTAAVSAISMVLQIRTRKGT